MVFICGLCFDHYDALTFNDRKIGPFYDIVNNYLFYLIKLLMKSGVFLRRSLTCEKMIFPLT